MPYILDAVRAYATSRRDLRATLPGSFSGVYTGNERALSLFARLLTISDPPNAGLAHRSMPTQRITAYLTSQVQLLSPWSNVLVGGEQAIRKSCALFPLESIFP
jgi:hypothetical protein